MNKEKTAKGRSEDILYGIDCDAVITFPNKQNKVKIPEGASIEAKGGRSIRGQRVQSIIEFPASNCVAIKINGKLILAKTESELKVQIEKLQMLPAKAKKVATSKPEEIESSKDGEEIA